MVEKSKGIHYLIQPVHRFRVFQERDYNISLAEMAVLQTSPIQRLRGLRQIGLGYLALPTAEHSRLVHSLGTAYWAVEFLTRLRSNNFSDQVGDGYDPPGNHQRLAEIDEHLGPDVSLDLVVRLFALVHDMTLLPLGHTLQFQLGYYGNEEVNAGRANCCLQWIQKELKTALNSVYEEGDVSFSQLYDCLVSHLSLVRSLFHFRYDSEGPKKKKRVPRTANVSAKVEATLFPLVIDLIASTFSADLVDFALRDSLGAGMPRTFDEWLGDYLCVFCHPEEKRGETFPKAGERGNSRQSTCEKSYRLGLNPLWGTYRHEVVTGVMSLQRIRYELAEKVFYHEDKLVADAMLDRAIRLVDDETHAVSQELGPFNQTQLLRMGDEDLLKLIETKERQVVIKGQKNAASERKVRPVMPDLLARRLYKEAFRVSRISDLSPRGRSLVEKAVHPKGRTALERKILRRIPELAETDVIFSSRPFSMQAKPSSVLIGWMDGQPAPLMDIARRFGYATEALDLADRYQALWSLSVYLHPEAFSFAPQVQQVCRMLFQAKS
jgi:HD superfamily phosphohydrolase